MKDKELKFEGIEVSHTRWSGGRSCPGEREVEKMHRLLFYYKLDCFYSEITREVKRIHMYGCL